jgi:hypothetical protein
MFKQSLITAVIALVVLGTAGLASAVIHTGSGTYNYPPNTTGASEDVFAEDTTKVNLLTGGSIGRDLITNDNSTLTVSGGSIGHDVLAYNDSTVTVSGGSIGEYLVAFGNSTMTIIGSDFNFAYGDYFAGGPLAGQTLTGFLADGMAFDNDVYIYSSATVTLAAPVATVPEPATAALVLLGAGGLMCRRRAA